MRFWLDRGVDGFRMDVINVISKPWGADGRLPDAPVVRPGFLQPAFHLCAGGPQLEAFLHDMKQEVLRHYRCVTVGETPTVTTAQARRYTDAVSGSLDMVFQFEQVDLDCVPGQGKWATRPLPLTELKQCLARWQHDLHRTGWNSLYLSNHDQARPVSRYGDDGRWRVESAKLLGTLLHGLQGTPYIYQGEELGMTNIAWPRIEDYRDIETLNWWRTAVVEQGRPPADVLLAIQARSRDNARTPMHWSAAPGAGFSSGQPWIGLNPNHVEINAEAARAEPDSVFHHYRQLVALRQREPVLVHGDFELLLPGHPAIVAYRRRLGTQLILVLCNLGSEPAGLEDLPALAATPPEWLLGNWPIEAGFDPLRSLLRPWEARMLKLQRPGDAGG
jgi:oligo-1,6-glucosidase